MDSELSTEPALSPRALTAALRRHFSWHNAHMVGLAVATFAAALVAWAVLFFLVQWLTLLAVTVTGDGSAPLPRGLPLVFAAVMACLLAYAWIDRRLTPDERARDQKSSREIAGDFLLALPRLTLGAGGTLGARQHLTDAELALAADFLLRLAQVGRVPVTAVGFDLPDREMRERILFALEFTGIIETRRGERETSIGLAAERPAALRLGAEPAAATRARA